jgi:uncharacterized repeat protein (TIGR03803 family)
MRSIIRTLSLFLLIFAAIAMLASGSTSVAPAPAFTVLHSFNGVDGGSPNALLQTADGFFYGSAANGGDVNTCNPDGCGTLFKSDSAGNVTVLHVFHATDGYGPTGLVKGSDGNFYGTTGAGGAFRNIDHQGGFGTVYQFNPTTGVMRILHSFNLADGNGIFPNGPLVQATDGFLYGTTREGGPTVFKVDTSGNLTLVTNIPGQPLSGLIQATDGSFYGTEQGTSGGGSVYRVDAGGKLTFLDRFDGADGWRPNFRLLQASDGSFYGTAPEGGMLDFQGGDIYRLNSSGTLRVLHSFTISGPEGFSPNAQVLQGLDGALYGVNGIAGNDGHGTIFKLNPRVPAPVASITVNPTLIHSGQSSKGTVTLSSPAAAGGTAVKLGTTSSQMTIPSSVTVPAGTKTATFAIRALHVGAAQTARIYASFGGQGVRTSIMVQP